MYAEPYSTLGISKINTEIAVKYGGKYIQLKRSLHDSATYPCKLIITKPGDLREADVVIGFDSKY